MNTILRFCLTHSADYDGIFSAEIVRHYYKNDVKVIALNYSDKLVSELFEKFDFTDADIIISDFSFPDDMMQKFVDICHEVVWCDHHKTAIDRITQQPYYTKIKGCQSTQYSGAELVWAWLYNNGNISDMSKEPDLIRWIGIYDTWRFKDNKEKEEMLYVQDGLKAYGITFNSLEFPILLDVRHEKYQTLIDYIVNIGKMKRSYQLDFQFHLYTPLARTVKFNINGRELTACAINARCYSDMFMYAYDPKVHDFCIKYVQSLEGKWGYSVYVMSDKTDRIDATEIVAHISPDHSGGHAGCAGASTDILAPELA